MEDKESTSQPQTSLPDSEGAATEGESLSEMPTLSPIRKFLRWVLSAVIMVGLGVILAIFTLYVPMRQSKMVADNELLGLSQQATADRATAESQTARLAALQEENEKLLHRIEQAEILNLILNIRVDVVSAQLALMLEDTGKAHLALSNTANLLDELEQKLPVYQRSVVNSMKVRLDLVLQELEKDAYAAQSDLDVLSNALTELQNALTQ